MLGIGVPVSPMQMGCRAVGIYNSRSEDRFLLHGPSSRMPYSLRVTINFVVNSECFVLMGRYLPVVAGIIPRPPIYRAAHK